MSVAISVVPPAASCTDRDISLVVAVCSSTALAIVVCRSEIWATTELISSIAFAVSCANSLTSFATTAKPLPACALVSSADAEICAEMALSSSDLAATASAEDTTGTATGDDQTERHGHSDADHEDDDRRRPLGRVLRLGRRCCRLRHRSPPSRAGSRCPPGRSGRAAGQRRRSQ